VPPPRPPAFAPGFVAFLWGLLLGAYIWGGLLSVGVSGATAFIIGAVAGAAIFVYVRTYGADAPRSSSGTRGQRAR
jgi:hypothetical protein